MVLVENAEMLMACRGPVPFLSTNEFTQIVPQAIFLKSSDYSHGSNRRCVCVCVGGGGGG